MYIVSRLYKMVSRLQVRLSRSFVQVYELECRSYELLSSLCDLSFVPLIIVMIRLNISFVQLYTQTKVKQHLILSETLFWKLQNGICG